MRRCRCQAFAGYLKDSRLPRTVHQVNVVSKILVLLWFPHPKVTCYLGPRETDDHDQVQPDSEAYQPDGGIAEAHRGGQVFRGESIPRGSTPSGSEAETRSTGRSGWGGKGKQQFFLQLYGTV